MFKVSVVVILLVFLKDHTIQCRRFTGGGGRRPPSRNPSYPSHTHSAPAYHPPSPPPYHSPSHGSGSGTVRPLGFEAPVAPPKYNAPLQNAPPHGTGGSGSGNRPIGFVDPSGHQSSSGHPVGPPASHNQGTGTVRPLGFDTSGHSPGSSHTGHVDSTKQNSPLGNPPPYTPGGGYHGQNPPPYNPHYSPGGHGQPPAYNPAGHAPNPAGYGQPPAYNPAGYGAYNPSGYHPQGSYHPQGGYQPGYHPQGGGGGGVTVINNNINNNHHHSAYGGYGGYSPPVYTTHDTGSTALGFFLGYSLAKISTPSYFYHGNSYDSSTPRYDHYTVHHYYHNNQDVPKEATIQPNAIVACVGDSGSFCPANTTSLCTNNGAVMCVASALSTVPCTKEKQTNCVKSTVPCKDNDAPECKQSAQNTTSIAIPCISTAKIYGDISYVNNSIVISNHTSQNSTSFISSPTIDGNTTTNSNTTEINTTTESNTNYTTTTTSTVINGSTTTNATGGEQGPAQMFCVTILALPAERKLTDGEKLFQNSKNVFTDFVIKTWGIK